MGERERLIEEGGLMEDLRSVTRKMYYMTCFVSNCSC